MIPYRLLYPAILVFCCFGVYSVSNSIFDVLVAAVFGLVGVVFRQLGCSPAPLILALVLEPMLEENLRRAMLISGGSPAVFVQRPISLTIIVLTVLLAYFLLQGAARSKKTVTSTNPVPAEPLPNQNSI